jgi:hypothetical protein
MVFYSQKSLYVCGIRILSFSYDAITIYTSGNKVKIWKWNFLRPSLIKVDMVNLSYIESINNFGKDYVYTNVYLENQNTDNTQIDVMHYQVMLFMSLK